MGPRPSLLALAAFLAINSKCHALLVSPLHQHVRVVHHQIIRIKAPTFGYRTPPLFSAALTTAIAEKDDTATKEITSNSIVTEQLAQEVGGAFAQKLQEMEKYQREHGHCLVPKRYEINPSLGNWVNKQRQNCRKFMKGEKSSMNEKRIAALSKLGFSWNASSTPISASKDMKWQQMYNQLSEFHATNGHCQVPSTSSLGQWAVRQRFLYRQYPSPGKSKSSLTEERINALNKLNFPWMTRSEQLWEQRMTDLQEFKKQNGHCMVPRSYPPNPQLSAWVATQRKNYNRRQAGKTPSLSVGRIKELEEVGFVWSYWDHNFGNFK